MPTLSAKRPTPVKQVQVRSGSRRERTGGLHPRLPSTRIDRPQWGAAIDFDHEAVTQSVLFNRCAQHSL
jgi:hypothetical protein